MNSDERYEELAVKATDGPLSDAERVELEALLAASPERQQEVADFQRIKGLTNSMAARIRADAQGEPPRESPGSRMTLRLSWILLLTGVTLLLIRGAWEFAQNPEEPLVVKVGAGLLAAGSFLLLGQALRLRLRAAKYDPYQEIDR